MNILLCRKIIDMKIAPEKRYQCSVCGDDVGITKATADQLSTMSQKPTPICSECFTKNPPKDIHIMPLTNNQRKELDTYIRDGGFTLHES